MKPAVSRHKEFPRSIDALAEIFGFVGRFFTERSIDELHRYSVEFSVEEIFTNMVKYHPEGRGPIRIELSQRGDELEVALVDRGVDSFDLSKAPRVDTEASLEDRTPGGLGLQLTQTMMDSVGYDYDPTERRRTVTLIKKLREPDVRD